MALVRLLLSEPDILLLDEPTNHLDSDTLYWLEEHLRAYPHTVAVISHDRYFLDRVATKILDIEHTKATMYNGNYAAFTEKKAKNAEILEHHYKNQQREIARIEAFIAQQRRWNRERNIIAAESREKALARMKKTDAPQAAPKDIKLTFGEAGESGNDVLYAEHLAKSYGEKRIFSDISFTVKKNDRILILGPNGCGKSTLAKIIGGMLAQDAGTLEFGSNVVYGYYDQEQQSLDEKSTVLDEVVRAHEKLGAAEIRSALAAFLFFEEDISKLVCELSGGEKARLMLCKMMLSKINLLILDEPTNHLDINSREILEDAVLRFRGTVIAVSHDRYFAKKIATRIFDMSGGDFFDYRGGYDEYIMYARESGVVLPILYKNFIIDEYQLLQARHCGASTVLLIAAVLEKSHCQKLLDMAHALGLEVLLELHGERDFEQADLEPDMYGINNRNLGTFNTDVQNSLRLAGQLPAGSCKVSESGISSADTIARLRQEGFKGFLIGEHFMRAASPGEELGNFISQLKSKL